jgi:hypothetical protein
MASEGEASPP